VALLTETKLRSANLSDRPYELFDERGLCSLVAPAGGRFWRFSDKVGVLERLISLGANPDTPLERARALRNDARKLVVGGVDPSAERQTRK